jgi:peptide/nickel transport system ATP-binding protein
VGGARCADERPQLVLTDGRGAACHLTTEQQQTLFDEHIGPRLS